MGLGPSCVINIVSALIKIVKMTVKQLTAGVALMNFFIVTGQKSQKTLFPQSVEEILCCYSKDRNPHHNRQIKFIIDQLNSGQ